MTGGLFAAPETAETSDPLNIEVDPNRHVDGQNGPLLARPPPARLGTSFQVHLRAGVGMRRTPPTGQRMVKASFAFDRLSMIHVINHVAFVIDIR